MKKTTLKLLFMASQLNQLEETLKFFTEKLSSKIIDHTEFIIRYNPRGGYYNLYIQCRSRKDALHIVDIYEEHTRKKYIFSA